MQKRTDFFLPVFGGAPVSGRFFLPEGVARFFLAVFLCFLAGAVFAQRYDGRPYRKKPRTELSAGSKKGIRRVLNAEAVSGATSAGTGQALGRARADTERYRLEQDRELAYALDDPDGMDEVPDYMVRAMQAYRVTGDRNIRRFAGAASAFQEQALRDRAMAYLEEGDVENYNRVMAILSGRPYAPYSSVGQSGYVVNRSTGEIQVGNPHAAGMHDRKVKAETAQKNASAASRYVRAREGRPRTDAAKAVKQKTGSSAMTAAEYREARMRAIEANRPDLVRELDGMARGMGYAD